MPTLLPLKKMTKVQKIRAMNELWTDLTSGSGDLPSPAWHAAELAKRQDKDKQGEVVWSDWALVKERIRKQTHAY